ncbi:MAG: N-acetylmuramic acid 6-phosphate etherase [Cellulomonas sp. 73-92]|uniref:N-acetylmuramic acid 6-phosphate etherase n=1 Tax=Cellulomonas sp. 73-92 TaxID=1895740 RepID=UPI000928E9B3|nr:N-acetylmuramic acid 6-phosphate etherase [Cellulomonas sp. 73-92]OJV81069.1 MAG: N-acetylmuramic acid 6-phosphate etherase [Cellulomonas sp. 73-92]
MSDDLATLATEATDPRFAQIDRMSVADLAATMNDADRTVPDAVRAALPQVVAAISAVAERMARGGRLIYVGAGTPGRIAVLDASECPPTFSTPPDLVTAIIAGGPSAIVTPAEGAEDDAGAGAAAIDDAGVGPLDSVVGIASSGRTPYVVAAVSRARELGAFTVGLTSNVGSDLAGAAEQPIEVVVGPEVISGSTRLKAGTAQKLVLNMISTITMVRLGKTYGNLMVDVRPTNHKLRERAVRIVRQLTGVDAPAARAALGTAGWDVKVAAVTLRLGLDPAAGRERLEAAGGRLREAFGEV